MNALFSTFIKEHPPKRVIILLEHGTEPTKVLHGDGFTLVLIRVVTGKRNIKAHYTYRPTKTGATNEH